MALTKSNPPDTLKDNKVIVVGNPKNNNLRFQELSRKVDNLIIICNDLTNLVKDLKQIMVVSKGEKYTQSDLKICNEIFKKEGYLNNLLIKKDGYLSKKYPERHQISRLLNCFISMYPDLEHFRCGKGGRLWVCKKDNLPGIKRKAGQTHTTQTKSNVDPTSKFDKWGIYLQENFSNQELPNVEIKQVLSDLSNVTSSGKLDGYLNELKNRGYLKWVGWKNNYKHYKVMNNGGNP